MEIDIYIYSKYIEKVKIIIQKINDNIFDSKYGFLWESKTKNEKKINEYI
jgi:hypothetical protein